MDDELVGRLRVHWDPVNRVDQLTGTYTRMAYADDEEGVVILMPPYRLPWTVLTVLLRRRNQRQGQPAEEVKP